MFVTEKCCVCYRMLPGLGGEGAFTAVEIEKPDVVRLHGASEVS